MEKRARVLGKKREKILALARLLVRLGRQVTGWEVAGMEGRTVAMWVQRN